MSDRPDATRQAVTVIRRRFKVPPRFAVLLGTGKQSLPGSFEPQAEMGFADLPGFPRPTATGHRGRVVCGLLNRVPVVVLAGRGHLYEGYTVDQVTFPIRVVAALGATALLLTNAAGGINPAFECGDLMLIDSHLDLTFSRSRRMAPPMTGAAAGVAPRRVCRTDEAYDQGLMDRAERCAGQSAIALRRGVYAGLLGPNYETRAEYRWLRRIGADAAGMSTVWEVAAAAHLGLRVLALSVISNVARPDALQPTSGQEVLAAASAAAPRVARIVSGVVAQETC